MGGLFDSDLIPLLFVLVMLANVFLDRRNRRRRQRELPQEQPQETAEPTQAEQQTRAKPKDIAAEFERRLKKTTEEAQARKRQSSQCMTERVCAVMMAAEFTVKAKHCMTIPAEFTVKTKPLCMTRARFITIPAVITAMMKRR